MSQSPSLQIDLDPGPWNEEELRDYRLAGDEIGGRIWVRSEEPLACRSLVARVGWFTEGRGDRDQEEVYEQTLHAGSIARGEIAFPFTTKLPISPISYAGHYLNITWRVEAKLDVSNRRDPVTHKVFYVMPRTALS